MIADSRPEVGSGSETSNGLPSGRQLSTVNRQPAQEVIEQLADLLDVRREAMIGVEHVELTLVFAREANRVLDRNDVVIPAMHDRDWAFGGYRRVLFVAAHEECRREEEHAANGHVRRDRRRDVPAHARTDEDEIARDRPAKRQELLHSRERIVHPAIVDRLDGEPATTSDLRHRGNFRAPGFAVFAVGEDYGSHFLVDRRRVTVGGQRGTKSARIRASDPAVNRQLSTVNLVWVLNQRGEVECIRIGQMRWHDIAYAGEQRLDAAGVLLLPFA